MTVSKIYFDMDDTIADFGRGLLEICDIMPIPQDESTPEQDDAMWAAIRDAGNFYYQLKECEPGAALFRQLRGIYGDKVEILTAIPKPRRGITTSEADKRRWMAEHFGEDVVVNIAHSAEEKKKYVTGLDSVLVDDLEKNVNAWRDAGGVAIWFTKNDPDFIRLQVKCSGILNPTETVQG